MHTCFCIYNVHVYTCTCSYLCDEYVLNDNSTGDIGLAQSMLTQVSLYTLYTTIYYYRRSGNFPLEKLSSQKIFTLFNFHRCLLL